MGMKCGNCSFWDVWAPDAVSPQMPEAKRCGKAAELWAATMWSPSGHRMAAPGFEGQKMFVMDGSSYSANLYTTAEFFCAHFSKKGQICREGDEKMTGSRKYTITEIEALREAVRNKFLWGRYSGPRMPPPDEFGNSCSRPSKSFRESELSAVVEDRVRTCMLAGLIADDLKANDKPAL